MINNSLIGGRRGGKCSQVNLRCLKVENSSWFIGRVGIISYSQLRWHETFRSWLGTWKYYSSKFTTSNSLKTDILNTSKMNYSSLSRSISSLAKFVSFLCSFSSFFAYPAKVFPSGSFSPCLLLLTTSRFVELSFASFVPLPTPPFSHSSVLLSSSSVFLSCFSGFLSCSSVFLSCFSDFRSCSSVFLSCFSDFLSCSTVFLSCFSGFLSWSSVFLSQDSSSPSSVHVSTT